MSKNQTKTVYAEKDYVQVAHEGAAEPFPDPVPRTWLGTDLLPDDVVEFKSAKADPPVDIPEGEPTEKWTVPQIDAYAAKHEVDLGGASKKDEKLALIVAHFQAPGTTVTGD